MKVLNRTEVILNALPELKDVEKGKAEYVPYQNFDARMKRIESENLKEHGRSLTFTSLEGYFGPAIIELHTDKKLIVINQKAYRLIRKFVRSKEFVLA